MNNVYLMVIFLFLKAYGFLLLFRVIFYHIVTFSHISQSAATITKWKDMTINLIDTPGITNVASYGEILFRRLLNILVRIVRFNLGKLWVNDLCIGLKAFID